MRKRFCDVRGCGRRRFDSQGGRYCGRGETEGHVGAQLLVCPHWRARARWARCRFEPRCSAQDLVAMAHGESFSFGVARLIRKRREICRPRFGLRTLRLGLWGSGSGVAFSGRSLAGSPTQRLGERCSRRRCANARFRIMMAHGAQGAETSV